MDFVAGIFPTLSSCWLCGWLSLYAIWAWWFGYRTDYRLYLCLVHDFSIDRDCHVHERGA